MTTAALPVALVGDGLRVPCADSTELPYLSFDAAASTSAMQQVLDAVEAFLPWYSGRTARPWPTSTGCATPCSPVSRLADDLPQIAELDLNR